MSTFSAAFFSSSRTFFLVGDTTYFGLKFFFGSTPSCDFGRSRTWPIEALTMYFESRYFWIVFTFVGDSTTTRDRLATNLSFTLRELELRVALTGKLSHAALQFQREEERRRPPGRDAALPDQPVDVDGLAADQGQE